MSSVLLTLFSELADPRRQHEQRHPRLRPLPRPPRRRRHQARRYRGRLTRLETPLSRTAGEGKDETQDRRSLLFVNKKKQKKLYSFDGVAGAVSLHLGGEVSVGHSICLG